MLSCRAANATFNNIASQGINILTGQQKGFSWSSVAASAVGGAVGNYVGGKLDAKFSSIVNGSANLANNVIKGVASGIAGNVASQLTQIAIDGKGRLNWTSVAVSGIYGAGSGYDNFKKVEADIAQQRAAQGNTTPVKNQSAFTGERINVAGGVGRTDSPQVRVGGDKALERTEDYRKANPNASADELQSFYANAYEQPDLLGTNPYEGGLSIKAGAADNVKKQAENLNAGNSKANLGGVDQAISNIAADAVSQYYYDEQTNAMGYAMDAAAKSEHAAYRLEQAKRLNLETLATDTGEQFRQSGIGLKPYVSGASLSNWDVAADKAAALQLEQTEVN